MDTIGYALSSLFWIVDVDDPARLAPIGVVGELLIEGPVLAKRYFNDPVQTAAAFIEAPQWLKTFRPNTDSRLFRSGDLVKYFVQPRWLFRLCRPQRHPSENAGM